MAEQADDLAKPEEPKVRVPPHQLGISDGSSFNVVRSNDRIPKGGRVGEQFRITPGHNRLNPGRQVAKSTAKSRIVAITLRRDERLGVKERVWLASSRPSPSVLSVPPGPCSSPAS